MCLRSSGRALTGTESQGSLSIRPMVNSLCLCCVLSAISHACMLSHSLPHIAEGVLKQHMIIFVRLLHEFAVVQSGGGGT